MYFMFTKRKFILTKINLGFTLQLCMVLVKVKFVV